MFEVLKNECDTFEKYNPNVTDPDPKREHRCRFSGRYHPIKQFRKDKYSRLGRSYDAHKG